MKYQYRPTFGKIVTIIQLVGLAIVFLVWFVFGVLLVGVRLSQGL